MRELYCDRLADRHLARWAVGATGVCAECGEAVTAAPDPQRRLVCIPCLTRDSSSQLVDVHPINDPMHCGDCFERARDSGWSGTSEARLHSRWWRV